MSLVAICVDPILELDETITCNEVGYVNAFLMQPEAEGLSALILNGGIDLDMVETGFLGVMSLWVAGLTVGIILSQIRKLRM